MNKKINRLLMLLGIAFAITSCDIVINFNSENSDVSSTDSVVSDNISSDDITLDEDSYYQLPDWDVESYKCEVGLSDIGVNRSLVTGEKYNLNVSMSNPIPNPGYEQYISSNPNVLTITVDDEKQVWIECHHAGMAKIRIYDGDGDVRYCEIIRVADKISVKDMEDHLVYVAEEWHSVIKGADEYVITFFPNNIYSISGNDQNGSEFTIVTGTYEYVETSNKTTVEEYYYQFTDENAKSLDLEGFFLDCTGEYMHLWAGSATANILYPSYRDAEFEEDF